MTFLLLATGLAGLVLGGELLVRGAVRLAERLGMSPLLIGLMLVGFGTSAPELVTSVRASLAGSPGIAIGNVVGSNIANLLLILGVSALITPIAISSAALKRDGVLVVSTAMLLALVSYFWMLDRFVGVALVAGLGGYLVLAYRQERSASQAGHSAAFEKAEAFEELLPHRRPQPTGAGRREVVVSAALALGGLLLVVFGGGQFVAGAIRLARGLGISEEVIGLTVVAIGTSMPELVTSTVAALRKHADVAVGNVLGSNLYNTLGIVGVTALVSPTEVPRQIVTFDNPVMVLVSLLLLGFAWTGRRIARWEGAVLLLGYFAYMVALWPR